MGSSLSSSLSSSSWKLFDRRRRHSSPILLLSNKFAIKWRLRRSAVEATSAAAILSNWLFVVQQKMKVVCGRFLLLLQMKTKNKYTEHKENLILATYIIAYMVYTE